MDKLIVTGGCELEGSIWVSGSKNSALPILAATLLTAEQCIIRRVPDLSDTNYMTQILASLAPGGVLLYETFAHGNATVGKPSRPEFLLQPGELLAACAGLRIVAYEDGFEAEPARFVQRIAAVREVPGPDAAPPLYALRGAPNSMAAR